MNARQMIGWTATVAALILVAAAPAAQQIAVNGSLEEGPGPFGLDPQIPDVWILFGGLSERSDEANLEPPGAGHALKTFGPFETGAYQDVPALPGDSVTVSASLFTLGSDAIGGGGQAGIALEFYDAGEVQLDRVLLIVLDSSSANDVWIPGMVSATAPAGTVAARAVCIWEQDFTAVGSAYWDDCSLTINGGSNVLDNADFETAGLSTTQSPVGIDDWDGFGNQEKSTDLAFVGTSSLKMLAQNSGGGSFNGLFQDLGLVEAGDRIVFRAHALHLGTDPLTVNARAGIKMEFSPVGGSPTLPEPTENLPIDENADTNAWMLVDLGTTGLVVPDEANFARIVMLYFVGTPGLSTNGQVWFDDAEATLNGGGNQLVNASFESGPGGFNGIAFWTEFGLAPLGTTRKVIPPFDMGTNAALDGIAVAQSQGSETTGIFQDIAVDPGQILDASVKVYVPQGNLPSVGANTLAGIKVEWRGGNAPSDVDIGPLANTLAPTDPVDAWKELNIDFTMPAGSIALLRYTNLLGFVGEGAVYMDGCEAVVFNRFDGADVDGNGTMDLKDYAAFQHCFNGDGADELGFPCLVFDTDEDNDIDDNDWTNLDPDINFTGP